MTSAEPLAYEEEDEELNASIASPIKSGAADASLLGEKRKNQPNSSTLIGGLESAADEAAEGHKRRKKGGGPTARFIEMEAELSDEEGQGADVSEDEDEPDAEEDGMLVRAIGLGARGKEILDGSRVNNLWGIKITNSQMNNILTG